MKVGHWNVRSLFTGFNELRTLIEQNDYDIFFLSETWLSDGNSSIPFEIPNYQFLRKDRIGRGGGVAAYVKANYTIEIVTFDFDINVQLEFLIFKIKVATKAYAFSVFYRPPSLNFNSLTPDFDNIFSFLYPTVDDIFCLGDFNINLLNLHNPLTSLFENYNFEQIINEPTRISGTVSTLIDAIFVTNQSLINKCGVISADNISDHSIIYCDCNLQKATTVPTIIRYRSFKNFNVNNFLESMHSLPWDNIFYENNVDKKIELLNSNIVTLFDVHAPIKESRVTKPKAPWLTANIKVFMKQRDSALQKFKRTKLNEDWINYKYLRNLTLAMIRREKKNYLNSLCDEKNSKKIWSALRSFNICANKNNLIPKSLSDPNDINNFFAAFLQNISNCNDRVNFYDNNVYSDTLQFLFRPAEISDVNKILNSISTNATGVDEISPLMLKYCSPFVDKYITHIINCCLEVSYYPDQWKISIGKPLAKVSSPTNLNDLRVISILPAISKIFERILYNQMYSYFTNNNIIPSTQCGFRKGFGTAVALTNVADDIIRACDKKMNSILILLDFSKAFDTINHALLVSKLKYYGFHDDSFLLIKSYLFNRFQKVFSDNNYSEQANIRSGVPQGSILGPLLFLIYTSDILRSLKHCRVQAFADDTQIYCCFDAEDYADVDLYINQDLKILGELSRSHNLNLNPIKSCMLIFGNKNRVNDLKDVLNISVDGSKLKIVDSARNLGLLMDTELRFKEHLKQIFQKTYLSLKLLYSNRHIINIKLRKDLCESLVLSNFNYCDFVYGFCLDAQSRSRIQKVQNACLRFIYGVRKFDHISHLYRTINWLRMDERRILHLCIFVVKIVNNPNSPISIRERLVFRHNIHDRSVRDRSKLTMPHHQSAMFQRSFTYNAVKYYNSIPTDMLLLNANLFKMKYKKYLLNLQNS